MIFYCDGEKIKINNNKREIGHGSEGIVYRIGDSTYKIYYESALRDNYGLKEHHHHYLSTIPTKQIVMPEHAIYDEFGNYVGYSAPFIEGNQKDKTGISMLDKKVFLDNLRELSNDLKLLSDYLVVCADVQPINYVYNQNAEKMYKNAEELIAKTKNKYILKELRQSGKSLTTFCVMNNIKI